MCRNLYSLMPGCDTVYVYLQSSLSQPQMLVVSDVDGMFMHVQYTYFVGYVHV